MQAALNRVPVAFPATLRYQLAAANYRCLNNALELSLFTTLFHNLVLTTPRSTPIQQLYTYAVVNRRGCQPSPGPVKDLRRSKSVPGILQSLGSSSNRHKCPG